MIFYGLLVTMVLTAIPYGTVQPWWIALFECAVLLLGLIGLADLLLTKTSLPDGASLAVPALALCLFMLLQSLPLFESGNPVIPQARLSVSADRFTTFYLSIKLLALTVTGVLLLRYARTESRLRALVYTIIGIGIASALLGVLRQGTEAATTWFFPLPNPDKGFAQFVNRNHFGFLIEMSLGLALGIVFRGSEGYQRYAVFLPIALLLWVALIISNSRGGIFASVCEMLFLVILLDPLRRFARNQRVERNRARAVAGGLVVRITLAAFLVALFACGVTWIGGETVVSNFELAGYSFTEQGGKQGVSRKDIWSSTWQLIKAHPVAGSGFGAYWIAITRYHNASGNYTPQEAHNDYLELLASGGLIGSALVIWFFVRFIKGARNTLQSSDGFAHAAALGAVTGIFGVMIHNFVDFGLHVTVNAVVFAALVPIATRHGLRTASRLNALSAPTGNSLERLEQADVVAH